MIKNPYDDLRCRFMRISDRLLFELISEDIALHGYLGDENYKSMTMNILENFHRYGTFSEKQKRVLINYLMH